MKSEKSILTAFLLNLSFSALELAGGVICGSVAVASDAVHDMGDAVSIGVSYFLERKSNRPPDEKHTCGYGRYSLLGGLIMSLILLIGSVGVAYSALQRLFEPAEINYDGMTLLAVVGFAVNLAAAIFTGGGDSVNRRAVNLHMLEDVLGWAVVLVGSVIMRFTGLTIIDPLMSIGVAVFILVHAAGHLGEILGVFLEKTPRGLDAGELKRHLNGIDGVIGVHHLRVVSTDGVRIRASVHVVTDGDTRTVKDAVRSCLRAHGVTDVTVETEAVGEACGEESSPAAEAVSHSHHHHHH